MCVFTPNFVTPLTPKLKILEALTHADLVSKGHLERTKGSRDMPVLVFFTPAPSPVPPVPPTILFLIRHRHKSRGKLLPKTAHPYLIPFRRSTWPSRYDTLRTSTFVEYHSNFFPIFYYYYSKKVLDVDVRRVS